MFFLRQSKEHEKFYAKIKGIRALADCEHQKVSNKTFSDLKYARKRLKEKELFDSALVSAYLYANKVADAFTKDLENIFKYPNYETQIEFILCGIKEKYFKIIIDSLVIKLGNISTWQRNKLGKVISETIPVALKNKDYEKIIQISKCFSENFLEGANVLFELAYAYSQTKNSTNAKKIYEKIWKQNQTSSAVANNLALLYEDEGSFCRAKELFEQAIALDSNNNIAKNNLEILDKKLNDIQKLEERNKSTLKNAKSENIYIHEKLLCLIEAEDNNMFILVKGLRTFGQRAKRHHQRC